MASYLLDVSISFFLCVVSAPEIEVITRRANITAVMGTSEQLVCYTTGGRGDVTITWTRDRASMPAGQWMIEGRGGMVGEIRQTRLIQMLSSL